MRFLLLLAWFLPLAAWGQSTAITGKVTDADDGMGLQVSVVEKGTYNGTVTDLDGNYTLMVSSPEATGVHLHRVQDDDIACSGPPLTMHSPRTSPVWKKPLSLAMATSRSKISGAVGTIDVKDATSVPVLRTEQALQGRQPASR